MSMCYLCVIEASRRGKFVIYAAETTERCKKHPVHNLWEVRVSDEVNELLQRLISTYEHAKLQKEPMTDLPNWSSPFRTV
jgi:hypothetical protein